MKILKQSKDFDGYEQVTLCKNTKHKNAKVHRLVAEAFIPNPDGLPCVNHINEDKQSNIATNLEWCTVKYNCNHGTRNQRIKKKRGKRIYQYTLEGKFINEYISTHEAERQTGISNVSISEVANNKHKSAGGYRWSYTPLVPKGQLF